MPSLRRVVLLAVEGCQSLDVTGPLEVLHAAGGYRVDVVTPGGRPVRASSGLSLAGGAGLDEAPLHTLLVAGGEGTRRAAADAELGAWVARASARARRTASVCTGAFLLAAAGVLDGRRATTHWAWTAALRRRFPRVDVLDDPIFVRDGEVWTSAGVTAGIDLALALAEQDRGPEVARRVARELVVYLRRPGGQSQFSAGLRAQSAARAPLRDLAAWVADHPDADLRVEALAERAGMSARSFARTWVAETGTTPAAWVESVRVERARALLEAGPATLEAIAAQCGFGTPETMRRSFARRLGISPGAYRARFRSPLAA